MLISCLLIIAGSFGAVATLNSFNAGEMSPLLESRVDAKKYYSGCRTLENFVVIPQGGAMKRPGTQYIHDSNAVRVIPFEYSVDDAYVLSLENGRVYFYRTEP